MCLELCYYSTGFDFRICPEKLPGLTTIGLYTKNLCPNKLTGNRNVGLKFVKLQPCYRSCRQFMSNRSAFSTEKRGYFRFFLGCFFIVISLSCCCYFLVMSPVGITATYPSCYSLSVKHCFFFSKVLAINNTFFVCLYVSVCVCVCFRVFLPCFS